MKFIPLQLTIVLILGILTGYYFSIGINFIALLLVILILAMVFFYFLERSRLKPSLYFAFTSLILFYVIGIAAISVQDDLKRKDHYTHFDFAENTTQTMVLKIKSQLRPSLFQYKYEANLLQINDQKTKGNILLNIQKDSVAPKLAVGDKILVRAILDEVSDPKNPYQFNYKEYLRKQSIYKQLNISKRQYTALNSTLNSLSSLADQFRKRVNSSLIAAGFKGDNLEIINALLLGQRQEVSKELIEDYTKAGAIHILAISGLHVGIILWILTLVLKPLDYLKNGKTIRLIVALLFLWSFAFIAGLSPSVVRAVTMFSAVAISLFGKRSSSIYHNLIISIFFLLLVNPIFLFNVGFQLSYLAVFFIVWIQPIIYRLWIPKFKLIDYFWKIFTVSLAAQIGVLPLSLYYFHQFPGLFFITNLVIIPVLGVILGVGLLVIFLSLVNLLPDFLVIAFQKAIDFMNQFIRWVSAQESFLFQNISFSVLLLIAFYLFIIFSFRWMEKRTHYRFKYVLLAFIFLQTVFIYEKWSSTSKNEFIIFNKSRNSVIAERSGNTLAFHHSLDTLNTSESFITSYLTGANIKHISLTDSINKSILFKRNILLVDSLGSYQIQSFDPKSVLLTQSPKTNLERLIETLHPKEIIADNSNYKSYVTRWKKTCVTHKIPFHYTNENGAYILKE